MAEIINLNEVRKKKMLRHAALAERAIDPEQLLTLELLDRIAIKLGLTPYQGVPPLEDEETPPRAPRPRRRKT